MPDTFQSVLIGGAAGLVSAIITHFFTRAKIRLDLAASYDKDLQMSRLEAYKELWAILETLARYGRVEPVTPSALRKVSDKTRTWYFQKGGIYLTEQSRKPYFSWKAAMQPLLDEAGDSDTPISEPRLKKIIELASTLRTALSDDIGTKHLSRI